MPADTDSVTPLMRLFLRPLAALFAAAYLSAGCLALAFHSHAGHSAHEAPTERACTACHCGHDHGRASEPHERHQAPNVPDEHHDCVVCQFLAQPPLVAAPVSLIASVDPVVTVAEPIVPAVDAIVVPAWWSRGPPTA